MRIALIIALFFFTALTAAHAESFTGRCVEVNDGDIITVLYNNSKLQVRLKGLDCPEAGQDFGREALEFTRTAVLDRDVWINVYALDHEKKRIAEVKVDGRDLGMELVKAGLAWAKKDKTYEAAQNEAKTGKAGLWSGAKPVEPWVFRQYSSGTNVAALNKKDQPVTTDSSGTSPGPGKAETGASAGTPPAGKETDKGKFFKIPFEDEKRYNLTIAENVILNIKVCLPDEMREGTEFYALTYALESSKAVTVALTFKVYDRQGAVVVEHYDSRVKNGGGYQICPDFKRACKKSEVLYWTVNVREKK